MAQLAKGSAIISPGDDGTITFQNVDGELWQGRKALNIWLKGDGRPGPITAYFAFHSSYFLEIGKGNYTAVLSRPERRHISPPVGMNTLFTSTRSRS